MTDATPPTTDPKPADPTPPPETAQWTLRRALRTPAGETWELVDEKDERVGAATLHYGDRAVEGMLALPGPQGAEHVSGVLKWLTELLALDGAAGPAGVIHWVVSTGEVDDFWRRSPGHRTTGVETDVNAARARVEPVLSGMFKDVAAMPDGGYSVDAGSVRVFVSIRLVEGIVMVRVYSITNLDVPVDGDLPAYLMSVNFGMALGRFALDAEHRAVWFDHVLTADVLDDATLARTIAVVASTADRYDDEIKQRFGGRTFREEGSPVEQVAQLAEPGMAGGYL